VSLSSRALGTLSIGLVLVSASGCSRWQRFAPPPSGYSVPPERSIRLTLEDDSQVRVRGLRVDGDTLRFVQDGDSIALGSRSVVGYEFKRFDAVGTVVLVAAIGGLVYLGLIGLYVATGGASLVGPEHVAPDAPPPVEAP
jgi:hypothetical protein